MNGLSHIYFFVYFLISFNIKIAYSGFGTFVDISQFYNTQIASSSVCPKCLEVDNKNKEIKFMNCIGRLNQSLIYKPQRFNVLLANSHNEPVYFINQRYNNSILPFPNNLNLESNYTNELEIMPMDDDGGHYIKLIDEDKCLYHNYTIESYSNYTYQYINDTSSFSVNYNNEFVDYHFNYYYNDNSYSKQDNITHNYSLIYNKTFTYDDYFVPCDLYNEDDREHFKFYFFKSDYIYPEYRINVRLYEYSLKESTRYLKDFYSILKSNSSIIFTEQTTLEQRSYYFTNQSLLEVLLYEGVWDVNLTVQDTMNYYYKNSTYYHFPITRCNEDKEYGADIPIRSLINDNYDSYGSNSMAIAITAQRDVYIKNITAAYRSCYTCQQIKKDTALNSCTLPFTEIFMKQGECILIVSHNSSLSSLKKISEGDIITKMVNISVNSTPSFRIGYACKLKNEKIYEIIEKDFMGIITDRYFPCYTVYSYNLLFFDDSDINDSWLI